MRFFPIYVPETCPVHQYHPHKLDIFNCQQYFPACVMLRDVKVSVWAGCCGLVPYTLMAPPPNCRSDQSGGHL